MVLVLINFVIFCLLDPPMIGWQFTTYQAAEGTATVMACPQVLNGAANIGSITVQVSTNPGTALGRQMYKYLLSISFPFESFVTLNDGNI